jgi:hypothetical protein
MTDRLDQALASLGLTADDLDAEVVDALRQATPQEPSNPWFQPDDGCACPTAAARMRATMEGVTLDDCPRHPTRRGRPNRHETADLARMALNASAEEIAARHNL